MGLGGYKNYLSQIVQGFKEAMKQLLRIYTSIEIRLDEYDFKVRNFEKVER